MHEEMDTDHVWRELQKTEIKVEEYDSVEHDMILKTAILMIKSLANMLSERLEKPGNIISLRPDNIDKQAPQLQ